jgi:hypothetical protein
LLDLIRQRLAQVTARNWANLRRAVQRVAYFQSRRRLGDLLIKFLGDALDDDEALGGDAALPRVLEARLHRHLRRRVQVGVLLSACPAALATEAPEAPVSDQRFHLGARRSNRAKDRVGALSMKSRSICSAQRVTFETCLRTMALPAISAGAAARNACQ